MPRTNRCHVRRRIVLLALSLGAFLLAAGVHPIRPVRAKDAPAPAPAAATPPPPPPFGATGPYCPNGHQFRQPADAAAAAGDASEAPPPRLCCQLGLASGTSCQAGLEGARPSVGALTRAGDVEASHCMCAGEAERSVRAHCPRAPAPDVHLCTRHGLLLLTLNAHLATSFSNAAAQEHHRLLTLTAQVKTNYHILYALADLVPRPTVRYLELGVGEGASLSFMTRHPKVEAVAGLEAPLDDAKKKTVVANIATANPREVPYQLIPLSSHDPAARKEVESFLGTVDILYLDADPKYIRNDFLLYYSLVRPGGFIVIQHYHETWPSALVKQVTDAVVQTISDGTLAFPADDLESRAFHVIGSAGQWTDFDARGKFNDAFLIQVVSTEAIAPAAAPYDVAWLPYAFAFAMIFSAVLSVYAVILYRRTSSAGGKDARSPLDAPNWSVVTTDDAEDLEGDGSLLNSAKKRGFEPDFTNSNLERQPLSRGTSPSRPSTPLRGVIKQFTFGWIVLLQLVTLALVIGVVVHNSRVTTEQLATQRAQIASLSMHTRDALVRVSDVSADVKTVQHTLASAKPPPPPQPAIPPTCVHKCPQGPFTAFLLTMHAEREAFVRNNLESRLPGFFNIEAHRPIPLTDPRIADKPTELAKKLESNRLSYQNFWRMIGEDIKYANLKYDDWIFIFEDDVNLVDVAPDPSLAQPRFNHTASLLQVMADRQVWHEDGFFLLGATDARVYTDRFPYHQHTHGVQSYRAEGVGLHAAAYTVWRAKRMIKDIEDLLASGKHTYPGTVTDRAVQKLFDLEGRKPMVWGSSIKGPILYRTLWQYGFAFQDRELIPSMINNGGNAPPKPTQ